MLLLVVLTALAANSIRLAKIPSKSMAPTLEPGDLLVMRIDAYRHRSPARGDIVIFRDLTKNELLAKRVIGLPNESVFVLGDRVWIDRAPLAEPYTAEGSGWGPVRRADLGPDELWVMGDNRGNSSDSRDYGAIKESQLEGRAASIIWPVDRRKRLDPPKYE